MSFLRSCNIRIWLIGGNWRHHFRPMRRGLIKTDSAPTLIILSLRYGMLYLSLKPKFILILVRWLSVIWLLSGFQPALLHTYPLSSAPPDTIDLSLTRKDELPSSQQPSLPGAQSDPYEWWSSLACVHVCGRAAAVTAAEDLPPLARLILRSLMWRPALCPSSRGCQQKSPAASYRQHCWLSISL